MSTETTSIMKIKGISMLMIAETSIGVTMRRHPPLSRSGWRRYTCNRREFPLSVLDAKVAYQ
jgi:hypothetical protein